MIHTSYWLAGLMGAWLLTGFAPRFSKGRSWRLFGLASPLILLGVISLSTWWMAVTGCLHFTKPDLFGSLLLSSAVLLLLGGSLVLRWQRVRRTRWQLWRNSAPAGDARLEAVFADLARRMDISGVPLRWMTSGQWAAVATRDAIFLSQSARNRLDDEELEAVLAHELAHLKRRDLAMALFATWMRDAFFFLPACRKLWESVLDEREVEADRLAVGLTGRPLALASALLKFGADPRRIRALLEFRHPSPLPSPMALAFAYLGLWIMALVPLWSMWPHLE